MRPAGVKSAFNFSLPVFRHRLRENMMRGLLLIVGVLLLSGCMKASDLADEAIYQLRDVGVLDHSQTRRASPWRLQAVEGNTAVFQAGDQARRVAIP